MTGKVFSDSADIYQDQAQVLFEYYRQAAEKIVMEEMAIEEQMAAVTQECAQAAAQSNSAKKMLIIFLAVGVPVSLLLLLAHFALTIVGLVATGVVAFLQYRAMRAGQIHMAECNNRLIQFSAQMQSIRRDYRVERVGVAYVPVARRVPVGDKSYVVDLTGDVPNTEFSLTLINQPEELKEAMDGLREHMEQMPVVESNNEVEQVDTSDYSTSMQDVTLHDYMGTIDREVRTVRYLIDDSHDVSVSIPVVPPSSDRYAMLDEYATNDPAGYPVVPVFDTHPVQQKV